MHNAARQRAARRSPSPHGTGSLATDDQLDRTPWADPLKLWHVGNMDTRGVVLLDDPFAAQGRAVLACGDPCEGSNGQS